MVFTFGRQSGGYSRFLWSGLLVVGVTVSLDLLGASVHVCLAAMLLVFECSQFT